MCDDDRGKTVFLEFHQKIQKHLGIFIIQRRGRLIQDQKFNLLGKCLGDLYQLLFTCSDIFDQCLCRFMEPNLSHVFFCFTVCFVPVNATSFILNLVSEKHILSDRKQRNQCKFLMNNDDTFRFTVVQVFKLTFLAFIGNGTCITSIWILTT